jgi:hypothetical protein
LSGWCGMSSGVTLQINVAPVDFPHAEQILSHQLRQWGEQVDEVIFTLDLHRSPGKYGHNWEERKPKLDAVLRKLCARWSTARIVQVDYSDGMRREVSERFFGRSNIPVKDCFGAPFYAYFHGLHSARNAYVLHMDSDMLFGGGSQKWIVEAVELLRERPDVLVTGPLPGPPTSDGTLPSRVIARHEKTQMYGSAGATEPYSSLAYRFTHMSTRLFLIDLKRFASRVDRLELTRPRWRTYPKAEGHPRYLPAETAISRALSERSLLRIDLLGDPPGMWTVHPPGRSETFYRELPRLIERIEAGDIPAAQLGDYEVNDSLVDWSDVRAAARYSRPAWKRWIRGVLGREREF